MQYGLQAGFGDPLGAAVLTDLRALGFGRVRLDMQGVTSADRFRPLVAEVQEAGLTPLCIVSPEHLGAVPSDLGLLDLEVLNEADLSGMTPATYVDHVYAVYEQRTMPHRIWAGGVSNCTAKKLQWLRQVVAALPVDIGVTVHRYPKNGEPPGTPQAGCAARWVEMQAIQNIVGARPWGCSECGYHTGPQAKGWWLWRRTWRWTDAQIAGFAQEEMRWWRDAGAAFAVWYQLNDSPSGDDPLDRFGIRRTDGTWKPVAHTFGEA